MSDTFNWRLPSPPGDLNAPPPQQPARQAGGQFDVAGDRQAGGQFDVAGRPYSAPPDSDEPYIPSRNDRPHDQWGTPDFALQGAQGYPGIAPGPYMPQSRDLAPLLHGIVMGVGRWGSHYSAMPAIAMGTYASAYWAAYQKGMHERANQNWQQYRQAQQMFLDRQAEELREAKDINARYADDPDKLHRAMYQLARKNGDQTIINAIESGNYAAVDRIWGERDKSWTDAAKIKAQQDKQAQEAEERRLRIKLMEKQLDKPPGDEIPPEWRDPVPSSDGTTRGGTEPAESDTKPDEGDTKPDEGGPDTEAEPDTEAKPDTTPIPQRGGPTTTGQAPAAPAQPSTAATPAINPLVKAAADEEVRGGKLPQGIPKAVLPRIAAETERQKAALNDLMNNGTITGTDENADLDAIRKVNPNLARDIQAVGHYKRLVPVGGESMYAGMENLVRSVYPHWDPGIYKFIDNFRQANGKEQQMLQRVGTLSGAAEAVFRGLKDIDEKSSPIKNWIDYETGRVLTSDARWAYVGQAFYDYIVESLTAQNGGTKPTVSAIKGEMERFPITMGARAIRAMMAATALASVHRIDAATGLWSNSTHEPPETTPGYNDHDVGWLRTIANLDYNTGYPRSDYKNPIPPDLKPYLGPAGTNISKGGPAIPPGSPEGSKVMYDKAGKPWLVYPDKSVHGLPQ